MTTRTYGMTISEVARESGVPPTTLRYYESEGLLQAPQRVSGRRRYDASVLARLALVRTARACGFTVAEVGELVSGFPADAPAGDRWKAFAASKMAELDETIRRATAMRSTIARMQECECPDLQTCADLLLDAGCPSPETTT